MAEPFKNLFNEGVVEQTAARIRAAYPAFDGPAFVASVMAELEELELMARSKLIARCLKEHLPNDYLEALAVLTRVCESDGDSEDESFDFMPMLNFVGIYGLDHPAASLAALGSMTKRFSAEFDVRPYLAKRPELALAHAEQWSKHENWRVRRLASEGTRPRLPWGIRLQAFVADPAPVVRILDQMYNDSHPNVRRSVSNNLNDISKDHPELAVDIAERWLYGGDKNTKQLVSHALRTMRKQGHQRTLSLLGLAQGQGLTVTGLKLAAPRVLVGESLAFDFTLASDADGVVAVNYVVHHLRANGGWSGKVFHLGNKRFTAGESIAMGKSHSFRRVTTRRYYPGVHKLEIQAGGSSLATAEFELVEPD